MKALPVAAGMETQVHSCSSSSSNRIKLGCIRYTAHATVNLWLQQDSRRPHTALLMPLGGLGCAGALLHLRILWNGTQQANKNRAFFNQV
jgi:hypothetical protein